MKYLDRFLEQPEAAQHQQNGGDGDRLVDAIGRSAGVFGGDAGFSLRNCRVRERVLHCACLSKPCGKVDDIYEMVCRRMIPFLTRLDAESSPEMPSAR